MRQLLILSVIFFCLATSAVVADASPSDDDYVIKAFQRLLTLRSFRDRTNLTILGYSCSHCREWLKNPLILRTTITYTFASTTSIFIRTPAECYSQEDAGLPWTKWKARPLDKELLTKAMDYNDELKLGQCHFAYEGTVQLEGVQTRLYIFQGKPQDGTSTRGKVWIGLLDGLPRRFDCEASDSGPYVKTFDNFNSPVSTTFPAAVWGSPPLPPS